MKLSRQWFRTGIACLMFCTLFSVRLFGCSRSMAGFKVLPNFRVSVWHDTKPVAGIAIEIFEDEGSTQGVKPSVLTLYTDQNGNAEVKNLAPGVYVVATAGPGRGDAAYAIVAVTHPKPSSEIKLGWPMASREGILKTRTLTGVLASNNSLTPFGIIHAELWTAGVQEPLAIQEIGTNGHFQFQETKPGIYILRVRGLREKAQYDAKVEGDIPLELLPAKKNSQEPLSLYLGMSSCGISYDSCPVPSANALPTRRLQVHDPLGAIIKYSEYRVLNPAGAEVAAGSTGANGIVELPHDLDGMATLIVTKTGSPTFELPLYLIPPTDTAKYLTVVMGIKGYGGDNCSAAYVEKNAPPE